MIWDFIVELKNNINEHGIRWGIIFTIIAIYRKELRNFKLDKRDAAIFHNQKVIMTRLGVPDQWHGTPKISSHEDLMSLKRYFYLLLRGIHPANLLRRVKIMNENIKWTTLIPGLISATKLVLQSFGIDIPDEHINAIVNGAAAVGAIVGIFMSHRKGGTESNGADYSTESFK